MVRTIQMIGSMEYPDEMKKVMSIEEYVQRVTEKGYEVEVIKWMAKKVTTLRIYKKQITRKRSNKMIARKCDICGKVFTPYLELDIVGVKDSYYKIEVSRRTFVGEVEKNGRTRQEYDVCKECKEKFDNWVKGKAKE